MSTPDWKKNNYDLSINVPQSNIDTLNSNQTFEGNVAHYKKSGLDPVSREAMNRFYGVDRVKGVFGDATPTTMTPGRGGDPDSPNNRENRADEPESQRPNAREDRGPTVPQDRGPNPNRVPPVRGITPYVPPAVGPAVLPPPPTVRVPPTASITPGPTTPAPTPSATSRFPGVNIPTKPLNTPAPNANTRENRVTSLMA